jgi:hypothetical protein
LAKPIAQAKMQLRADSKEKEKARKRGNLNFVGEFPVLPTRAGSDCYATCSRSTRTAQSISQATFLLGHKRTKEASYIYCRKLAVLARHTLDALIPTSSAMLIIKHLLSTTTSQISHRAFAVISTVPVLRDSSPSLFTSYITSVSSGTSRSMRLYRASTSYPFSMLSVAGLEFWMLAT